MSTIYSSVEKIEEMAQSIRDEWHRQRVEYDKTIFHLEQQLEWAEEEITRLRAREDLSNLRELNAADLKKVAPFVNQLLAHPPITQLNRLPTIELYGDGDDDDDAGDDADGGDDV